MRQKLSVLLLWTCIIGSIWLRWPVPLFPGVDAACYGRIAKQMSLGSFSQMPQPYWGETPFYEHPPLGLWIESMVFRVFGSSAETATLLARCFAMLLVWLVFRVASKHETRTGHLSAFALTLLPGFLFESQNWMFELPLAVFCALGIYALLSEGRSRLWLFSLAVTLAFFTKGPPALALWGVLFLGAIFKKWTWKIVFTLCGVSLASTLCAIGIFEMLRWSQGLGSYFKEYFVKQVVLSLWNGRENPQPSPFFYLGPLLRWYTPGILALLIGFFFYRRENFPKKMFWLGAVFWVVVVVGFSVPQKKSEWYIHQGMPGAALVIGTVLTLIPRRFDGVIAGLGMVFLIAGMTANATGLIAGSEIQKETYAVKNSTPPANSPRVANCSVLSDWRAEHLFRFYWNAQAVKCAEPHLYVFNGVQLIQ